MEAVIDTNVLIHGRGKFDFDRIYVVPGVVEEVKSEMGKNILGSIDYEVIEPAESEVERVKEKSEEINSPTSDIDERLVAVAMERGLTLVTDDKAMQNLALHLDVDFEGFHDPALEDKIEWKKLCKNCGNEVSTPPCPRCGSRQIRRKQVYCS